MNVVFRVDASIYIGSGHVMRCLVLADELVAQGHRVCFACLPQEGDMITFIQNRSYEVISLTSPGQSIPPTSNEDYLGWLQRPVEVDAHNFIDLVGKADVVVTDHYAIGCKWQTIVRHKLSCKLVAIDDLKRLHDSDLIIDQTFGRESLEYLYASTVLAGSQYSLISPLFARVREKALEKTTCSARIKVLVTMGGIDAPNATIRVLKCLSQRVDADFTVLLGPRSPHFHKVKAFCSEYENISHIDFVEDMPHLMLQHDMAIGAPGSTTWERASLGLPSIIIPLAPNQNEIGAKLDTCNIAIRVSLLNLEDELPKAYVRLIEDWPAYRSRNFKLCDGRGVKMAVGTINRVCGLSQSLHLEKATDTDIDLVYQWQCHPNTRKYALNTQLPSWDEHVKWMSDKIESLNSLFYIAKEEVGGKPLGVYRLDRISSNNYLVSIFVAPDCYRQGVATRILQVSDIVHSDLTLHATVLEANTASQALFEQAGYQRISSEKFIRFPID
ncbi:UDP-2,4-diacetamido-2,4,6-trideoxy-beta-L-altropyranose hydrolase [Vibrio breoganii]|uniref:UDP-2,4-diacetamido-2,4, 6-trideoxy-beta-L-altropyranose hydrolase n=1 Tax=Vibrio breoganii TaxID=553239 RepID=A0AAN0XSS1_9VIBR|nr:UDP-2,4-diacetamido-2,4,6-trideoxy-beta-L-altropyranose hydrolase [Vibrio breoganii]ANO31846.1 UDP-2,4-diacetamido-2,4,6-trideoxy-beta-L-altropyranose hydrolase [Vibrio breoganii]